MYTVIQVRDLRPHEVRSTSPFPATERPNSNELFPSVPSVKRTRKWNRCRAAASRRNASVLFLNIASSESEKSDRSRMYWSFAFAVMVATALGPDRHYGDRCWRTPCRTAVSGGLDWHRVMPLTTNLEIERLQADHGDLPRAMFASSVAARVKPSSQIISYLCQHSTRKSRCSEAKSSDSFRDCGAGRELGF